MFTDKTILLIDDSTTIRNYLKTALTQRHAKVEGVGNGAKGLERVAARAFDLVIVDLILPDLDGMQVLQSIRATNTECAVVMLTGIGGVKSAMLAVQKGADGYLLKQDISGSDLSDFMYALERAMEHRAGLVAQKQLEKFKADFYSMITHDLRNPSATVLMAVRLILESTTSTFSELDHELLRIIKEAAERSQNLIHNYLDFAKLSAGYVRLELARADLCAVVRAGLELTRFQAQTRGSAFTLTLPAESVWALVDAARLQQVFDNLGSNAVKYTPLDGQIRATLTVEAEQVRFSISDTGRGIPADELPHLFTKYYRVRDAARDTEGTGLGLLIVKEIIEAHGGTVQVESAGRPGQGTTFIVTIPLKQGAKQEA